MTKSAREELAVCAALGLRYYSVRFVDLGSGIKNVMKLDDAEIRALCSLHREYGLEVATLGSPIGKVKLVDQQDGTRNPFIPFAQYLEQDVRRAMDLAHRLDTRLLRGFSFYPPKGADPEPYFSQAVDWIGQIAEACRRDELVFGLEIEANLVGSTGERMIRLYEAIQSPALVLIFDGANLSAQNLPAERCFEEYLRMTGGLGWMHIKDYRIDPALAWTGHVDEERLKNFVPVDRGDSGHKAILRDFRDRLPELDRKMRALGAPGVFLDLEPHLRGGGQFGGVSGPDGLGIALRSLCRMLDEIGIGYSLRDFDSIRR